MKKEEMKKMIKGIYIMLSLFLAFFSADFLWYWNVSSGWSEGYNGQITLFLVGSMYCVIYWFFAKMYQAQKIGLYRLVELLYFQFLSYGMADGVLYVESVIWFHSFEKLNILFYILVLCGQIVVISMVIFVCNRFFAYYDEPRKIVVIYGNDEYVEFLKKVNAKKYRYKVVACLKDTTSMDEIKRIIEKCDSVYLYNANRKKRKELTLFCDSMKKNIYITQDIEDLILRGLDVSHTFDIPFLRTKRVSEAWYYPIIKRIFDIVSSCVAIIVLSPVFIVTAVAIKCYDGGPVLYKQVRLTKGHREFIIYKFRSMVVDAEKAGARLSSKNDARITPVGRIIRKTRIDELPQLFNILKGDMSVIGPRPERPEIEEEYVKHLPEFSLRLQVPAGLSGYAQVFGKYNTTPANKLKLDLLYINQRSLLLDFKLIFYTIKILFLPESTEGIDDSQVTAEIVVNDCKGV